MRLFHKDVEDPKKISTELSLFREILLSNLIMLAEIPSPTGDTQKRAQAIATRLSEHGTLDVSIDKAGNVIARIESLHSKATNTIALLAHIDTHHRASYDHTVHVHTDSVVGVSLTDNSIGAAVLLVLPFIIEHMKINIKSDIILCFAADSLGNSDLSGTRFFLNNIVQPIHYGICVEGYPLGRISYSSIGMFRGELIHKIPEEFDWSRFGTTNAIVNINHVINKILEIALPSRPRTSIIFNKLRSGASFNTTPTEARLLFEVRSESTAIVDEIYQRILGIISESTSDFGAELHVTEVARRSVGGLTYDHLLVKKLSEILQFLLHKPRITPSFSDLSAFIEKSIPAIGLGITQCERYNQLDECMYIQPCFDGIAQLLFLLSAIDAGEVT